MSRIYKTFSVILVAACCALSQTPAPQTAPSAARSVIGTVTAIDAAGKQIKIKTDAGVEVSVNTTDATKFQRVSPGTTDLKTAPESNFAAVAVGDRIQAGGKVAEDGKSVPATRVLIMTKDDVSKVKQSEQDEWQKRGVSGTLSSVEAGGKQFVIAARQPDGTTKPLTIVTTVKTQFRRYAPDSIKFSNAKTGTFGELSAGDQVRALGVRSSDGGSYAAEEIVSGAFRTLAATVVSVDAASGTMKLTDLDTKKPVTVKVTGETSLHRIPAQMATMLASRASAAADAAAGRPAPTPTAAPGGGAPGGGPGGPGGPGGGRGGRGGGGGGDMNQMIERMPAFQLAELKPGDALIINAGKGSDPAVFSAITMIAGVEAILSATPASQRPMLLGNWSVDAGGGGGTP